MVEIELLIVFIEDNDRYKEYERILSLAKSKNVTKIVVDYKFAKFVT